MISGHDAMDGRAASAGHEPGINWQSLATGGGTIVVLMGVAALPAISAGLLGAGIDPMTPVAIVQDGWSAQQRVTSGTITDIACRATEVGVQSPAVIVIGDVAALAW